jgi:hypothetical protein
MIICVHLRICVCMYICMCVCMYVCMYVCVCISMYLCMYVCVYVSCNQNVCVYLHACLRVLVYFSTRVCIIHTRLPGHLTHIHARKSKTHIITRLAVFAKRAHNSKKKKTETLDNAHSVK